MQRTRWLVIAVLVLVGTVWVAQGAGLLRGSGFMDGDSFWAFAGLALIAAGALLAATTLRHRGA